MDKDHKLVLVGQSSITGKYERAYHSATVALQYARTHLTIVTVYGNTIILEIFALVDKSQLKETAKINTQKMNRNEFPEQRMKTSKAKISRTTVVTMSSQAHKHTHTHTHQTMEKVVCSSQHLFAHWYWNPQEANLIFQHVVDNICDNLFQKRVALRSRTGVSNSPNYLSKGLVTSLVVIFISWNSFKHKGPSSLNVH